LIAAWGIDIILAVGVVRENGRKDHSAACGRQDILDLRQHLTTDLVGSVGHDNHRAVREITHGLPGLAALLVGSLTGILSAVGLAKLFGADRALLATLAPKSATTPIAMGIAESTGGEPSLTAVVVILTGILGAVLARPLMTLLGVKDRAARGFALGVACHGLGTAAAFEEGPEAGTLAGLAMGLNGFLTALLVPLVLRFF